MDRKQYFEELHIALTRGGFTSQPEQDELLPVEWDGLPLCRITADGGVRYRRLWTGRSAHGGGICRLPHARLAVSPAVMDCFLFIN